MSVASFTHLAIALQKGDENNMAKTEAQKFLRDLSKGGSVIGMSDSDILEALGEPHSMLSIQGLFYRSLSLVTRYLGTFGACVILVLGVWKACDIIINAPQKAQQLFKYFGMLTGGAKKMISWLTGGLVFDGDSISTESGLEMLTASARSVQSAIGTLLPSHIVDLLRDVPVGTGIGAGMSIVSGPAGIAPALGASTLSRGRRKGQVRPTGEVVAESGEPLGLPTSWTDVLGRLGGLLGSSTAFSLTPAAAVSAPKKKKKKKKGFGGFGKIFSKVAPIVATALIDGEEYDDEPTTYVAFDDMMDIVQRALLQQGVGADDVADVISNAADSYIRDEEFDSVRDDDGVGADGEPGTLNVA